MGDSNQLDVHTSFDGYRIQDGQLVSERVQRIIMAIQEYEPNIRVDWIPDRQASEQKANQFKIVYSPPGEEDYILFFVKNEEEFDERVLQKIIMNDQRNGSVTWDEYRSAEMAVQLVSKQVWLDKLEEASEMAAAFLRTTKDTYKYNDNLILRHGVPFNIANQVKDQHIDLGNTKLNAVKKDK